MNQAIIGFPKCVEGSKVKGHNSQHTDISNSASLVLQTKVKGYLYLCGTGTQWWTEGHHVGNTQLAWCSARL